MKSLKQHSKTARLQKYNFWQKIIFQKEIVWINKLPLKLNWQELSSQVVIALRKTWLNSQSWLAIKLHIMPSCDLLAPNSTQWKAQSVFDWIWLVKGEGAVIQRYLDQRMDSQPSTSSGITRVSILILTRYYSLVLLFHSWNPLSQRANKNVTCKKFVACL